MVVIAVPNVAAEIAAGDSLTPPKLAHRIPTHPSTVFRWVHRGIPDGNGGRIRLEAIRRGRVWLTSFAAYQRFLEAHPTNNAPAPTPRRSPVPSGRSADRRQREQEAARAELAMRGM